MEGFGSNLSPIVIRTSVNSDNNEGQEKNKGIYLSDNTYHSSLVECDMVFKIATLQSKLIYPTNSHVNICMHEKKQSYELAGNSKRTNICNDDTIERHKRNDQYTLLN